MKIIYHKNTISIQKPEAINIPVVEPDLVFFGGVSQGDSIVKTVIWIQVWNVEPRFHS